MFSNNTSGTAKCRHEVTFDCIIKSIQCISQLMKPIQIKKKMIPSIISETSVYEMIFYWVNVFA